MRLTQSRQSLHSRRVLEIAGSSKQRCPGYRRKRRHVNVSQRRHKKQPRRRRKEGVVIKVVKTTTNRRGAGYRLCLWWGILYRTLWYQYHNTLLNKQTATYSHVSSSDAMQWVEYWHLNPLTWRTHQIAQPSGKAPLFVNSANRVWLKLTGPPRAEIRLPRIEARMGYVHCDGSSAVLCSLEWGILCSRKWWFFCESMWGQ